GVWLVLHECLRYHTLSEFITNLNSSEAFQTLSQKFSQLAQESGINVIMKNRKFASKVKSILAGEKRHCSYVLD
ncbi:MAG TPA: hypothetical protein VFY68_07280, partial [Nitrososphaeraceae archaeon]|nr:hypothetical protein [Nitrososphaeraceae archaeon]